MSAMRMALATSIHGVFLVAAGVAALGVIVALFLPEKPLRRRKYEPVVAEAAEDLTATGVAAPSPIPAAAEPALVGAGSSRTGI